MHTMVSGLQLIKSSEFRANIRWKHGRSLLPCLVLGRLRRVAFNHLALSLVRGAYFRSSLWCICLGSTGPAGFIVADGEFGLKLLRVGPSNGGASVASRAGPPTWGLVAPRRTASGVGAFDVILGGLLTCLFLCNARVDGVAEPLRWVLVRKAHHPKGE